jgi:hypothetical protein
MFDSSGTLLVRLIAFTPLLRLKLLLYSIHPSPHITRLGG